MKSPTANRRVRPIIRVFVSSTFSDLVFERNALQQHVWPLLEQLCLKHGFQFHAIDLRWGVSTEAGLDHRTMRICFEELRRSQEISPEPNFLILLGNRYGWRPLPEEISQEEFDRLVVAAKWAGGGRQPLPGTHGKSAEDVLNEWYRGDRNVLVPTDPVAVHDRSPLNYILQPRTQHLNDGRDYTRTKEPRPADTQDWLDVQQVLWTIINTAFAVTDAGSEESGTTFKHRFDDIDWPRHIAEVHAREHPKRAVPQIVRFQGSATEQEIWCGTLSEPNAREHVLAFVREIDNLPTAPRLAGWKNFVDFDPVGHIDSAAQRALSRLKQALRDRLGKNYVETGAAQLIAAIDENKRPIIDHDQQPTISITTSHIEPFWKSVLDKLTPLVQKQIDDYWRQTNSLDTESRQPSATEQRTTRELEIERDEHLRFGRERGPKGSFVGRQDQLHSILDYVNGDSSQPLVIQGAAGCGKTALLARAVEDIPAAKQPIVRFIGVTPRSSDLRLLLRSLCLEFRQRFEKGADPLEGTTPGAGLPPFQTPLPSDIRELIDEFRKHLQAATAEQPVILFLDALDQLAETDNGRQLFWIPFGQLPSHVKIVVSCLSDRDEKDPVAQPFIALQRRKLPAENMVNLDALSHDEALTLLFNYWLPAAGRTVAKAQRRLIEQRLESEACRQPLYLKLLFEEVKLWRWYGEPTADSSANREGEAPAELQANKLGDGVPALLEQLFARLSQPEDHGVLLIERVLGYIAAARRGLSETEILELLFADREFRRAIVRTSLATKHRMLRRPKRIPIAIWSRLRSDLAPYLAERSSSGANVLVFYHRQVAECVRREFVDKADWYPHRRLADYFEQQAPPRKLDEFLWQLQQSRSWSRLYAALSDVEIVSQMWQRNYFEIEEFWASLKKESSYRIRDAYAPVILSPEQYLDSLPAIVRLMRDSVSTRQEAGETLSLCQAMEQQGRNTGNHELLYRSLAEQGILHAMLGEEHNALNVYKELDRVSETEGNLVWRCVAIGGQASIHWELDDADEAMRLHKEEEQLARSIRNDLRLQASLGNQATILESIQQHKEALGLREEQSQLCRQLGQYDGLASALLGIATILLALPNFSYPETSKQVFDALQEVDSIGIRYGNRGMRYHANLLQYKTLDACILQSMQRNECQEAIGLIRQQSVIHDRLRSEFDDHEANAHVNGFLTQHLFDAVERLVRKQTDFSLAIALLNEAERTAKRLGNLRMLSLIDRQRKWALEMITYSEAESLYQSLPIDARQRTKRPEEPKFDLYNLGW